MGTRRKRKVRNLAFHRCRHHHHYHHHHNRHHHYHHYHHHYHHHHYHHHHHHISHPSLIIKVEGFAAAPSCLVSNSSSPSLLFLTWALLLLVGVIIDNIDIIIATIIGIIIITILIIVIILIPLSPGGVGFTLGLVNYWEGAELFTFIMVSSL